MKQQHELLAQTAGEQLKRQREEQKLSLATVAKAISLDEKLLGDIEEERTTHVAPVYRNGYIRTYARYLGIPEDEIQALVSPSKDLELPVRNIFSVPQKRSPVEKWLRATSYVVASLLIGTLAWQFAHEAVRLTQNASRLPNSEAGLQDSENSSKQGQQEEFGRTVNASIAPLGALHENNPAGLDTAEQAWAAVSRPAVADGESRIQVSVSADSWIEITDADGQELEMDLLRGGTDKNYHGKPPFRILFGRASAVRLSIDGEAVDLSAYKRDDVVQLSWPLPTQTAQKRQKDS
jgi:cytoskeleton protein RodZ